MADVSKIKLPNNSEVNIKDSRISGVDTAPTSDSTNIVTSGGVYTAINEIPPYSAYNFTSGCLVKTTYTSTENHVIYANIEGRVRGKRVFSTKLTAYYLSSAFNSSYLYAERYGWGFGNISLFVYNGYLYLWFKQPSDYCHFFISVYGETSSGPTKNLVDTVTNSAIPSGATATASVTPLAVTLPTVSTTDNGKVLTVSNGAWTAESLPSTPTFYSGTSDPSGSLGANGDIYIKLSS